MIFKHHVAINSTETVKEHINFEREDQIQGLVIKLYHNDNRIFDTS